MTKRGMSRGEGARGLLIGLLVLAGLATLAVFLLLEERDDPTPNVSRPVLADGGDASLPDALLDARQQEPRALEPATVAPEAEATEWPAGVVRVELSGRVVDEFGAPWPGAEVLFAADRLTLSELPELKEGVPGDASARYPRVLTDANGRFVIHGPRQSLRARAGTRQPLDPVLAVAAEGMAWHGFPALGFTGESMDVGDLELVHAGASFELRVIDEQGAPLEGVVVQMASSSGQAVADDDPEPPSVLVYLDFGSSDAEGRVRVEHRWPTTLQVAFEKPGYTGPITTIVLPEGSHVDLGDIVLTRGLTHAGRVVDAAGQPIAGARVSLAASALIDLLHDEGGDEIDAGTTLFEHFSKHNTHASTDADGQFVLENVGAMMESGALLVAARGYRIALQDHVPLHAGASTVVMQRAGKLSVSLRHAATDAPLVHASLRALQHTGFPEVRDPKRGYNSLEHPYAELTVEAGQLFDAGPLDVVLFADAPGYVSQRLVAPRLEPGEERALVLRLQPDLAQQGRALDASGAPVADVLVEFQAAKPFGERWGKQTARSGPDGSFEIPMLLPGTWSGTASKPGHAEAEIAAFDSTQPQPALELVLPRGARIHGLLLDAEGAPAVARWLAATPATGVSEPEKVEPTWARSDRDGRYEFHGLTPGEWLIESTPGVETWVSVVASDDLELDLQLAPAVLLLGTTRRGSEVLPRVRVGADFQGDDENRNISTRSRGDGSYSLELPEAGLYKVFFYAREGTRLTREVVVQPGGATRLDVDFGMGVLAGRASLPDPSAPLPDRARVQLKRGDDFVDSMSFDDDGGFRFEPLVEGEYTLVVSTQKLLHAEFGPISLGYGERLEDLVLNVELGAQLDGRVTTPGSPAFTGFAHLRRLDGDALYQVQSVNGAFGWFDFSSLPPGRYRVDLTDFEAKELGYGEGRRGEPGVELPYFAGEEITLVGGEKARLDLEIKAGAGR